MDSHLLAILVTGSFFTNIITLIIFMLNTANRKADTEQKKAGVSNVNFEQLAELSRQRGEEVDRLKIRVFDLEKLLREQDANCQKQISILRDQIQSLASELADRSTKRRRTINEAPTD
jgi:hypothetical protein